MITATSGYLNGRGDGFDHVWDDGSELRSVHSENSEAVIVEADFPHEKE
jgi:hypothetical protein